IDWSDTDRIVSNDVRHVLLDCDWWRESSSWQTRENNSASLTRISCVRERLTGIGVNNLASEIKSFDIHGNLTTTRTYRDRDALTFTQITDTPDSIFDVKAISIAGLLSTNITASGIISDYTYDALGRQLSEADGRGNVTETCYDEKGRVVQTLDGAGNVTTYTYDALGRRTSVTDPNGMTVTTAYDAEGHVISQRGATYPVDYAYDEFGNKVAMMCYREEGTGNGDITRWFYDEATGLVTNKVYADGKGPSYTYTPDGKLATRTWARGVVTTYTYDNSGALTNTVYSDDTPTISMVYDRVGNMLSAVTDGVCTNLYAYSLTGLCTNEVQNGATIARSYDALGRSTGYTLQTSQNASVIQTLLSYDALGRIASITSGTNTFTYSYLPGTDIVDGYTCGNFSRKIEFEPLRNLVAAVTNSYANRVISAFDYTNDAAGRRIAISRSGEAFGDLSGATDSYGYNSRNEVISARRIKNGEIIHGFNEDFEYDTIGNRIWSTTYNELGEPKTSQYIANNLNQYTSRTVPGYAAVRGHADADATVTVNEKPTYRYGEYFFGSDEFDNSQFAVEAELITSAVLASPTNGPDEVCSMTSRVHIPKATQHFTYDLDGNLSTDGYYTFTYDSNNRLKTVSTNGVLVLTNFYDEKSRRVKKVTADAVITFFYDDWNLVEERIVYTNGAMSTIHYCWGTDLSGTLHGAGGVGGLLYLTVDDEIYIPCYDNNGNITQYIDVNGYSV
ncbi:MAG: RHS repeat protein, partial [Kiritimatiellae bacterium]|nr:RHS repeat protein [Kiritimatiellia bacterium]